MLNNSVIHTAGIETEEQAQHVSAILKEMIGVKSANVNIIDGSVEVEYETPSNLDSIEKEIYDAGYKVIY
ncbi:heavy-metal-associated domain-containing protein [Staphylococcus simiae]|uniref:putative copper chaperone CsoZ n=1 Tax=Staphylococcus simiae TaxID=308354 RepID=UPI001A973E46|nr:heavy metal-associated domain-containing protein [Staphylococcus simiae]MBO1199668.1 heavy-metal-associated domain-containing protein [Staphylococcus simiae]MBO1202234.1 heavy-metal-associated domain-containing protein [Staphylococcus simiae]MBO1204492.1 heavy-metal-associated domain-containing protein [Staphylococcus simiae]MBO1211705.1 heavy-metal-associated domain-containing protein [Staphylococcus simiae]MBO1230113.1 heavy-metal-associated domain-containing protein [Staphylococcus simia